jgi:hypothetical protein
MFTFQQPHVPCAYNQLIHCIYACATFHFLSLGIEPFDQMHVSFFIHIKQTGILGESNIELHCGLPVLGQTVIIVALIYVQYFNQKAIENFILQLPRCLIVR